MAGPKAPRRLSRRLSSSRLDLDDESQTFNSQFIQRLQAKHLLDESQAALPGDREADEAVQPGAQYRNLAKNSTTEGHGEDCDTQRSDTVDFGFLLEAKAIDAQVAANGDGRNENALSTQTLGKKALCGREREPASLLGDRKKSSHRLDDQIALARRDSNIAHKNAKDAQQHTQTPHKPATTRTSDNGRKLKRPTKGTNRKMDDWQPPARGSYEHAGSPTQENDSLAYAKLHPPTSSVPSSDDEGHLPSQAKTNATEAERSYDKDEIGGVRFSFTTSKVRDPICDPETLSSPPAQDEGYTNEIQMEPETPAPPQNPFARSIAPLQGTQLFNNTQSSPVDPRFLQSASSRPSPGMFGFGPQSSRDRGLPSTTDRSQATYASHAHPPLEPSSPSQRHAITPFTVSHRTHFLSDDDTPISRPSICFSFNQPVPHEYITREESQERRLRKQAQAEADSDSEQDSFEREHIIRARQKKAKENAAKELAQVSITFTPKQDEEVEVPATARRRKSASQEYISQCFGYDARDTQSSSKYGSTQEDAGADVQMESQVEMMIADSQIMNGAPVDNLLPDELPSRSESDVVLARDSFNARRSNTPTLTHEFVDGEASSPLPALDHDPGSESGHRESSVTPSVRVPLTSSGRFPKNSSLQTSGPQTRPVVFPSTGDDMIPETSPAKSSCKLFDVVDSPAPSIVSLSHIGFTQDDPEYDEIASPIRGAGVSASKYNVAVAQKSAVAKKSKVAFFEGSSIETEAAPKPSYKPVIPSWGAGVDYPHSSPVQPAARRASRRIQQAPSITVKANPRSKKGPDFEDDAYTADQQTSPIRPSIETVDALSITKGAKHIDAATTERLPCPFCSAGKPCNMEDREDYYHDEEIRQLHLRKHGVTVPNTSSVPSSNTGTAEPKISASLPSKQHSDRTEKFMSPGPSAPDTKPSEQFSEYASTLGARRQGSTSSSLSELPSDYDNNESSTAGIDNDSDPGNRSEGKFTNSSRNASVDKSSARKDIGLMPPPTVRRTLRYSPRRATTSGSKSGKGKVATGGVQKRVATTKGTKQKQKQAEEVSERCLKTSRSMSSEPLYGDSITIDQTPIRTPRRPRAAHKASINYDCESSPIRQPQYGLRSTSKTPATESEASAPIRPKRDEKAIKVQGAANRNLFANMAFAISYKGDTPEDKAHKNSVTAMISSHGGSLLDGFNDLFTDASTTILATPATAAKAPAASTTVPPAHNNQIGELALAPHARDLGFVAFIGDHYTRKTKFVQALALGLPCLSGRWVAACVARGRAVPFAPYLLAAGESAHLGGAVRSRLLAPYEPATARLRETFARRQRLLAGKRVVFLMGRGRAEERKRAYLFLTRALGAAEVRRVTSVREAGEVVGGGEGGWDLVYVDDDRKVAAAEAEILGEPLGRARGGGRKRKGAEEGAEDAQARKRVKVVGDEFVVQSLILGCLVDEE